MKVGFIHFCRDLGLVPDLMRLAERHGYALVGFCDSPGLAYDPYVGMTIAAAHSERARLGPSVTNPQTRHPLIVASLAASLEAIAPGRTFLGLGVGNSGVMAAGVRPVGLSELARAATSIRALLRGGEVPLGQASQKVKTTGREVPIVFAGSGEKSLTLAGAIADEVWVNVGLEPATLTAAMDWVRRGALSVGRDPKSVRIWIFAIGAVAQDSAQAKDEATGAVLGIAKYVLKADSAGGRLPAWLAEPVGRLLKDYAYGEHLTPGRSLNYRLAEELGIADYLLSRFAVAGTPRECVESVAQLAPLGAEGLILSFSASPDLMGYVDRFGGEVLPAIS